MRVRVAALNELCAIKDAARGAAYPANIAKTSAAIAAAGGMEAVLRALAGLQHS